MTLDPEVPAANAVDSDIPISITIAGRTTMKENGRQVPTLLELGQCAIPRSHDASAANIKAVLVICLIWHESHYKRSLKSAHG